MLFINKRERVTWEDLTEAFGEDDDLDDIIAHLKDESLISYESYIYPGTVYLARKYCISPEGKAYLEQRPKIFVKDYLPIIISVLALIGAYRAEILWLVQAIMRLWK